MRFANPAGRSASRPRLEPALPFDPRAALAEALASALPTGSVAGMEALAAAILNRARVEGGPDAIVRIAAAAMEDTPPNPRLLEAAGRIARRALSGLVADPTRGATLWHRETTDPDWARSRFPCHSAGGLLFYAPPQPQNVSSPQTRTGSGKSR